MNHKPRAICHEAFIDRKSNQVMSNPGNLNEILLTSIIISSSLIGNAFIWNSHGDSLEKSMVLWRLKATQWVSESNDARKDGWKMLTSWKSLRSWRYIKMQESFACKILRLAIHVIEHYFCNLQVVSIHGYEFHSLPPHHTYTSIPWGASVLGRKLLLE